LIGGAPGSGKTALTMQLAIDALRMTDSLRVAVCNIEMPATVLMDRQLARLSGIDLNTIQYRQLNSSHAERLARSLYTLSMVKDRLCFVRPPFDLENVAAVADAFGANLLVLDYIQRISTRGRYGDRRGAIDATMSRVRRFADDGKAVVTVAAVARVKDFRGRSSYDGDSLNLASFRESSELEHGADDAFILAPSSKILGHVELRHFKARHTEPKDIALHFDRAHQSFSAAKVTECSPADKRRLPAALSESWSRTQAAEDNSADKTDERDAGRQE